MSGSPDSAPTLKAFTLAGPAGGLEALLRSPAAPRGAAVMAHPHPLFGGTMHTKVVQRSARLLSDRFHLACLRFNFRGVGASEGTHDGGRGETEDLLAAVRFARELAPSGPFLLGGFSFGSLCAIRAAVGACPDVLFLVGLPIEKMGVEVPEGLPPEIVAWVQGESDQYGSLPAATALASRTGWRLSVVPGADHFFTGRLDPFEEAAAAVIAPVLHGAGR